jgi:penicillin-binding protein 2
MRHTHVRWFIGISGIVMAVLMGQLFQLQVVHGARNQALADGNRIRQTVIRAPRGAIYDRKQNLLARNVANFDLTVIPAQLPRQDVDREVIFQAVSDLSGVPLQEIKDKIEKAGKAVPVPVLIQPNVSREVALKVEEKLPDLDGVDLDTNAVREYLDTGLLSQFLGYTGRISDEDSKKNPDYQPTDYIGKVALERGYEADLRGTNGAEQVEVDATGKPIKVLASKDPVAGSSVQLSIDFGLQKAMADELKKQVDASGSGRGAAVAVVIETSAYQHEVVLRDDDLVLQVPGPGGLVTVDVDLGMRHAVLGDHVGGHRLAHECHQRSAVGEVVLFAEGLAIVADDVVGERVGELVPVLGVECT